MPLISGLKLHFRMFTMYFFIYNAEKAKETIFAKLSSPLTLY